MTPFWIGVVVGAVVGGTLAILGMALLGIASALEDRR